jgi:2-phosphosulfolactate phosphatase
MDFKICKRFNVDENIEKDDIVIVVDALRASATAATLLSVGAKHVRPVIEIDPEDAPEDSFLVGEANGQKIEGYDLGNSPSKIRTMCSKLQGHEVILRTSNGTQCVREVAHADEVYMASLVNQSALVEILQQKVEEVSDNVCTWFVPARKDGDYAREDMYTCHKIREAILKSLSYDFDQISYYLADSAIEVFTYCTTGQRLVALGYQDDIEFCSTVDQSPAVPRLKGDRLVPAE